MHESFSYLSNKNHIIHVLLDKYEVECFMLNKDTLEVRTPSLMDGVYGMLEIVEDEIETIWDITKKVAKSIISLIENEELMEDYPKLYQILKGMII